MSGHVIVISEDALVFDDLQALSALPTYASVWRRCARVERVRSIYPTLTYPAHTTLCTGVFPDRHGIVDNEELHVGSHKMPWQFDHKAVMGSDLFDLVKRNSMSSGAVFWPVTGNHPSIDYNVPECWPEQAYPVRGDCFEKYGSSPEIMKTIVKPNLPRLRFRIQPYWDSFLTNCACDIIREYKPNLLMLHPAAMDGYRHQMGVFSPLCEHGLHELDDRLCFIMQATEDAGIIDDTNFFIVSDHGQLNTSRIIKINALLREYGFISVDENGEITDYTAFCKSVGMSAMVYLKDPRDKNALYNVGELLRTLMNMGVYGISRVYSRDEAEREERLSGYFSFVIETDGYTAFSNDWNSPVVMDHQNDDYRFGKATHGYHPDKGPQPTLIAFGPDIKENTVIDRASLTDEAPTFAAALGLTLPNADGMVLRNLFR